MNTILAYTLQDKNDLCAILSRNGYVATAYNIVSTTENTCCGKQWRIDYYNPKEMQNKHIEKLEKENVKLKSKCMTCVYTDTPCIRSDYSSKNGVCDHYKNVFEENASLKLKLEVLEEQVPWKDIKCKSEVIGKLSKAKEIIKNLLQVIPKENIEGIYEVTEEAEQFLYDEVEE